MMCACTITQRRACLISPSPGKRASDRNCRRHRRKIAGPDRRQRSRPAAQRLRLRRTHQCVPHRPRDQHRYVRQHLDPAGHHDLGVPDPDLLRGSRYRRVRRCARTTHRERRHGRGYPRRERNFARHIGRLDRRYDYAVDNFVYHGRIQVGAPQYLADSDTAQIDRAQRAELRTGLEERRPTPVHHRHPAANPVVRHSALRSTAAPHRPPKRCMLARPPPERNSARPATRMGRHRRSAF